MTLSKAEIREKIRSLRESSAKGATETAAKVHDQLLALPALRDAKSWFIYVSFGQEVGTHELIHSLLERGDTVTVPRISGRGKMIAQQIHSFAELHLGEFGILAPAAGEPFRGTIDVCICPGMAFTERGDRLGWGSGFYDRYLAAHSPRLVIGLAFEYQIVSELPSELHDRRMDFIVTPQRVIQSST